MTVRRTLAFGLCLGLAACTTVPVARISGVPPLDAAAVAAAPLDDFSAGTFTAPDGTALRYRLLAPAAPVPGRRYPLVVQFHGSGGIGTDNIGQLENAARAWALPAIRSRYPAFVLVPQFPVRSALYDDPKAPRVSYAAPALDAALTLVDAIAMQYPVDRDRVYATGFSMGGSTTWLSLLARPGLFAAAMPISGIAPDRARAAELVDVPLLILHGQADDENPIEADRAMATAIRAAGGRRLRLREYAGLGHRPPAELVPGSWWRDWLFAQHRSH
ncbi:prolyl oligopeptidase family serine peptidase [Thermomonas sp.]|uniref:carboxylesterase family protein n=1 Tax=Thermomonas sp. TaxID=1971895 RepID=UPI0035B2AEC2